MRPALAAGPLSSGPVSAAPGNQTPSVPADPAAGERRRSLFAAAVVVGLLVVAVGLWALTRGNSGGNVEGTAIGEAVSAPAGPDSSTPTGGTGTSLGAGTTEAPTTGPTASTGPSASTGSLIDPSLLASALINEADLGGIAVALDDSTYTSGQDADHPLSDYAYCNQALDRSQAGGAAKRVLTTNPLSPEGIVASTATVFTSAEAASAVIDQIVANARACTSYTVAGALPATVTITSAERTTAGALVVEQVDTVGASAEIRVYVDQVGDLVTTLEATPATADPARLEQLLTARAAKLPR